MACVDTKRLRCSVTLDDPLSKVFDNDNTSSSLVLAPPLDDEDLLQEILLRLPPKPSSLPRASLVCKNWRSILSDPEFLKRFRKRHHKPPLLGFFTFNSAKIHNFFHVPDTKPDRIPTERFIMPTTTSPYGGWDFLGCRHGLAVLVNVCWCKVVVWDPLTGQQHCVPFPRELHTTEWRNRLLWNAAVLCADTEDGHVHGDCFSSLFKLALIWVRDAQTFGSLYNSASGAWGNTFSLTTHKLVYGHSILVGNALCWFIYGGDVLALDLKMQTLGVIEKPKDNHVTEDWCCQLLRMKDGTLGLAVLSELTIRLWERRCNCDGAFRWVLLQKTIPLEGMLPWGMHSGDKMIAFMGYDEDTNAIVLTTIIGNFMLQLDSMQIKRFTTRDCLCFSTFYPYTNFYTAGRGIEWKWFNLKV